MGGGNPLKKIEKGVKTGAKSFEGDVLQGETFRDVGSVASMGVIEGGRERIARREAEQAQGEQEALLREQQSQAQTAMEERKKRMLRSRQGRRGLLSGSVKGTERGIL